MYTRLFKRLFDLVMAVIGLVVLLPLFIIVTLCLAIANDGEVFYFQERPGLRGQVFRIVKLKTMNDRRDSTGKLLADEARLTHIGRFIRTLSFDELPQLFNVLKGDMSLVGPRPLLVKYLSLYSSEQARRHEVRPGITGWAQVTGRNNLSWDEKFKRDVWYVDHISFALDIKILWLTIMKVFKREGINQQGRATMEPFQGSIHSDQ